MIIKIPAIRTILLKGEKIIRIKASKDRKAHKRKINVSEIDKINRVYNQLCSEMGIIPNFIHGIDQLKQKVEELKIKSRKNPSSIFYMT